MVNRSSLFYAILVVLIVILLIVLALAVLSGPVVQHGASLNAFPTSVNNQITDAVT